MTKAEKEAAKAAKQAEKEAAKGELEIEVGDPQVLRPVELPLVVKPADGEEWTNDAQAEYAKVLNAYAYKNSEKWAAKKDILIANLKALSKNPNLINKLKGINDDEKGKVSYKNKVIEN